jgi:hydroxyacylglutathione hydrolase
MLCVATALVAVSALFYNQAYSESPSILRFAEGVERAPTPTAGSLNIRWIHGAADCSQSTDPPLQTHQYAPQTFILRESKCLNFEGNFLYLLLGRQKALLLDTGSQPQHPQQTLPLRETIEGIMRQWTAAHGGALLELIVAHSHSHRDHVFGDTQFRDRPNTIVVPRDVAGIKQFYNLPNWPHGMTTLDLGGRLLTILPTPGHEEAHITVYDATTQLLFTGDTLYPGLLTVVDWPAYRSSVSALAQFASTHPITAILGAHIEMTKTPRQLYRIGTTFQPDEHVLSLDVSHLRELHEACEAMGNSPHHDVHNDFIIEPR